MKEAFYFPHFCNARHDRKVRRLRMELGVEGYGIFFMLLETLREQTDFRYPIEDIDVLSHDFGTSEQKIRTVIANYGLFQKTEGDNGEECFTSMNQINYLEPYFKMKEQRRLAGIKSGQARKKQLPMNDRSTTEQQSKVKESKVKESKVKESKEEKSNTAASRFTPPPVEEVKAYCQERNNSVDPQRFVDFYASKGWLVGKSKMKDWRASVRTWERNDDQKKTETQKFQQLGTFTESRGSVKIYGEGF